MLKRGAQGPQGSKEDEGAFGMASTPDDKPHRATAAQLASRKIKDIRKRRAPTPTTSGGAPDAAPFNPFAAAAPAPTQSSGFTFGQAQSQSFPGASSGPSQGGIFSSGTNGQAAAPVPFSFGAGSTSFGSAPSSNPFSVDTSFGGSTQPSSNGFSFGGFKAGGQSAPSFGGFGTQQNSNTPANAPASTGLFGKPATQITSPADDSMQTSPDPKPQGASMFAPKPAAGGSGFSNPFSNLSGPGASNNIFAPPKTTSTEQNATKPAESQPFKSLFGSTPAVSKPSEGEKAQPAESQPFKPLFGSTPAASKPSEGEKAQPAESQPFKPLFGSTPAASKPSEGEKVQPAAANPFANLSAQPAASSNNIFAPKPVAADSTSVKPADAAKPFGSLFGSTPSSQPSGPSSNVFAPKPAGEEAKASNPFASLSVPSSFGALPSPKVTGTGESSVKSPEAQAQPFKPLFGTSAASKVPEAGKEQTATPAFGNLFSPKPAGDDAGKPAADQPFKSIFGTPAAAKSSETGKESPSAPALGNMFSPKPAAEEVAAKPVEAQPFKSMFGTTSTSKPAETEKEPSATSSLFAPKVTGDGKSPQFGSVTGPSPTPSNVGEAQTTQTTPNNPFASLSGQKSFNTPFAPKATETTATVQAPSTSLFGASTAVRNNNDDKDNNKDNEDNHEAAVGTQSFTATPRAIEQSHKDNATETTTDTRAPSVGTTNDTYKTPSSTSSSSLPSLSSNSTIPPPTASNPPLASSTFIATEPDDRFPQVYPPVSLAYPDVMGQLKKDLVEGGEHQNREQPAQGSLLWKVRMVTEVFRREVAECNPMTDDIDDIILLYVDLRRELGCPVGSMDPTEAEARDDLDAREAANEPTVDNPPPPRRRRSITDHPVVKKPEGGNSTVHKFAQSFSAQAPVSETPVSTGPAFPANASSAAAPVSAAPVSTAPIAAPATGIPKFDGGATSSAAPAFAIPKFDGGAATSTTAPTFQIPKFGGAATGTDFMAQFKAKAEKTAAEEKAKRKAAEFDSDEENEEEWERKDAERQRKKKEEIQAAAKHAVFVPGQGFKFEDANTAPAPTGATTPPATQAASAPSISTGAPSNPSVFGPGSQPVPASENIFGGLQPTSLKRKVSEQDSGDDVPAPAAKKMSPPAPTTGGSLFGRVQTATPSAATTTAFPPAASTSTFGAPNNVSSQPAVPSASTSTNEPNPTGEGDDEEGAGEVFDLTKGNSGEEEETVLFEDKSRCFKKVDKVWASQGTGPVRVLQHPVTKRARVVVRAEPSGKVILNTLLKKEFDYGLINNSAQFLVPEEGGALGFWALRVKRERVAEFHALINQIKN